MGKLKAVYRFVLGKLLLQSLDKLKAEYRFHYDYEDWKALQRDAVALSDPPEPIPPGEKPLPASAHAFAAELLSRVPEPEVPHNS